MSEVVRLQDHGKCRLPNPRLARDDAVVVLLQKFLGFSKAAVRDVERKPTSKVLPLTSASL